MIRGTIDVEDLSKLILILLVVYLAINVIEAALGLAFGILGLLLDPLVALIVIALVVLWYFDYI